MTTKTESRPQSRPRGRPRHDDLLTPAEWRVVEALRHGMSTREIAQRRDISIDAVKFHIANACGKLGLNGVAALRRWDGVTRASPLHGRKKAMVDDALKLASVGQISRSVSDIDAAIAWYRDVLGLTLLFAPGPGMAFFDLGDGVRLYLQQSEARAESILYFNVADIMGMHEQLLARGAVCTAVPHMLHRDESGTELWMAFYQDNDAALVAHPHARLVALMAEVKARTE
jgi:DNA-binding CsgD family transcriptional regulator/catechol 2,3-dioxygenase-like lactoylglutathione lyase family enzyme